MDAATLDRIRGALWGEFIAFFNAFKLSSSTPGNFFQNLELGF